MLERIGQISASVPALTEWVGASHQLAIMDGMPYGGIAPHGDSRVDDFAEKILAEEADLERKLAAVRQLKAAYGLGPAVSGNSRQDAALPNPPRQPRTAADRLDKFGDYGQGIIDKVLQILPGEGSPPMPTRKVVETLDMIGVEIKGENKVNALSALMARSSKIKGYGRAGWTLVGPVPPMTEPASAESPEPVVSALPSLTVAPAAPEAPDREPFDLGAFLAVASAAKHDNPVR